MVLKRLCSWALVIWLTTLPAQAQDAKTILDNVSAALGAGELKTLQYTAAGSAYTEVKNPGFGELPSVHSSIKSYMRELDLTALSSRVAVVRLEGSPATEKTETRVAAANAPWEMQYDVWLTPYGFLKGAIAHGATVEEQTVNEEKFKVVTFTAIGDRQVSAFVNSRNLIDKIQTKIQDAGGEVLIERSFVDYHDLAGLKVPTGIVEKRNGFMTRVVIVNDAKPNAPVNIPAVTTMTSPLR